MMKETILPNDLFTPDKEQQWVGFYDYSSVENEYHSKIHFHCHAINLILEGTKEIIAPHQTQNIPQEHVLFITRGHCLMTNRLSSQQKYRSILLFFDDKIVQEFIVQYSKRNNDSKNNTPLSSLPFDPYLNSFALSIALLIPTTPSSSLRKTKLFELFQYLTEQYGPEVLSIFTHTSTTENNFRRIIENHIQQRLTLEQLAFLCNMSLSRFKRVFQDQYEMSPARYFKVKRLEHSAMLLKTKQATPGEIYEEAGFESFSAFVQSFKKEFGVTPKQYQNTPEEAF